MTSMVGTHIRHVRDPEEIQSSSVLALSTSLKNGRSAARLLLEHMVMTLQPVYSDLYFVDLRDHPLPLFDGVCPEQRRDPAVDLLTASVERAGALLVSIPAYWSGVSGVFKNLVDVLCGPTYDLGPHATTVFRGKPVGIVVVGADDTSAMAGGVQARSILLSTGAALVGDPVLVSDPRAMSGDASPIAVACAQLAAEVAREAHLGSVA